MQLSANTQVKTIDGHYTGHFKAVITKCAALSPPPSPRTISHAPVEPHRRVRRPQNVFVLRDVACAGYVAGGNCLFFGEHGSNANFTPETVKEDIEKRLAFSEDVGAKYASMLAFPMWDEQLHQSSSSLDTVMSVSGRLLPWEVTGTNSAGLHNSFPGGEAAFRQYSQLLGLRAIHFGEDLRAAENQDFISQVKKNATLTGTLFHSLIVVAVLHARRARRTIRCAFLVRTASTTRSRARFTASLQARAISAATPSRACVLHPAQTARLSPASLPPNSILAQTPTPRSRVTGCALEAGRERVAALGAR